MTRPANCLSLLLALILLIADQCPAHAQVRAATIAGVSGDTMVRHSGAPSFVNAVRTMSLLTGDVVRTGPNGRAVLHFVDGSEIRLNANTVLYIPSAGASRALPTRFGVSQGEVWARIIRGRKTRFETPSALAWVRGTELDLVVAPDQSATLTVGEGEVRFENAQGSVNVREGEQSIARPGERPTAPVAANLPILLEWTNAVLPPLLLVERRFISANPEALERAAAAARQLSAPRERRLREADVLHDQGRRVEALAGYDAALLVGAAGDAAFEARLAEHRGQTLMELGRLDDAEAAFRSAVAQATAGTETAATGRAGLAMTLLARGQVDAARAEAAGAAAALPPRAGSAAYVHLALGVTELRRRDLGAAAAALGRAGAADPRDGQVHAWQSAILRARNDLAGAEREAREAVALAPRLAISHQALADVSLLTGRGDAARREARQAAALDPLSSGAHVSLANAELLRGRVDLAAREAHQGVALDPKSAPAQYTLAAAASAQRDYAVAERHLRQALALDPGLLDARSLLGRVLVARGKREEAVAVAQETLSRNPDLPSARAALGQVYRLQGRLKEAAREYEAALAASPGNALYHAEAARVYLDLNDLPAALSHAQSAVFLLPGSSEAHATLGLAYDRQENHEQAVREYREAISLSPENSLARLGLVTAFTPRSRDVGGSGAEQLREQAQALLRDPAVLQQVFEPGVTSEIAGGLGEDRHDEQRYLHRGQSAQGRVHDLSIASRFADAGYRPNSATNGRVLQSNVAVQATPRTQALIQLSGTKDSGGLPETVEQPAAHAYFSRRQNEVNLHARHALSARTHLWFGTGIRSVRVARTDPDGQPSAELPGLSLYRVNQRGNEHVSELRLDHQAGRHLFTYGLADLRLNARLFDFKYAVSDSLPARSPAPDAEIIGSSFLRDFLHYLQDDYRIGERGSLILGTQWLRRKERNVQAVRLSPPPADPDVASTRESGEDLLPYMALTYHVGARNLVRVIANKTRLRPSDPRLAPSEAFIVGEPISLAFTGGPAPASLPFAAGSGQGGAETYELDYEHRFSPRTFAKLFLEQSRARDFVLAPSLEQQLVPIGFFIERARAQIAGVRFEHQINRHLSSFLRWSYFRVTDRTPLATGPLADPADPGPNPSLGLQVPFVPKWRGLWGLNYIDRRGTKVRMVASYIGRRFTDVGASALDPDTFGAPTFDRRKKRPTTGPHVLLDLRIAREPSVAFEVSLTIANLLNTTFPDNQPGFPTRGRTWLVTVARRY